MTFTISSFAQQKSESKSDLKKVYGEAAIATNYVDKGVTQSEKSWALQSGFGYKIGSQSRLGVWGSSIKYPTTSESVNLRVYFDVKMDFTANANLLLRYDFNRFFSSGEHNGSILSADFSAFNYHVIAEMKENWEATGSNSTWFGFRKEFSIPWSFIFTPTLGYSQIMATDYTSYFDTRMSLGYKFADMFLELVHTYNSNSSQFNGRGDMAFFFITSVKF